MNPKDFAVGYTEDKFNPMFREPVVVEHNGMYHLKGLLDPTFIEEVNSWFESNVCLRANLNGKLESAASIGSDRISVFDEESSQKLYEKLIEYGIPSKYTGNSDLSLNSSWESSVINPLWRGIRYNVGDALVAHYDDTFVKNSGTRSLMSVVLYFTQGETHFMTDPRENHNYADYKVWKGEVDHKFVCNPGDVLVFDHRLFHSCPKVNKEKRIIRTDLMYK